VTPLDENGVPGAIGEDGNFDGGDSAAIIGTLGALNVDIEKNIPFNIGLYVPIRHPDTTRWYGQPDRFSRDQLIPAICMGTVRYSAIFPIFQAHKKRFFLTAWNTKKNGEMNAPKKWPDFTGPEVWALWIRYKKPRWARFVLWALDLELLFSSIVWKFRSSNVTRNHMLSSIVCRRRLPTIASRFAYWLNDWPGLIGKWKYHCTACREYDTSEFFIKAVQSISKS
jgi:hypothetical protein